ncbi:MAG: hypothetical protein JWM38_2604 [Sphingomonas bacterium]|nr:hypothetical protein [Sphingomonas bacterium]
MADFLLNAWYAGARANELGEQFLARRLLDQPILFWRTANGDPVAMLDRCPHRFASLHTGRRVGDAVECLYHGLRFDAAGRCTRSPYSETPPANAVVPTFPVVEHQGMVWIWMGDAARGDPALIPDHPHNVRADLRPIFGHETFRGNWQLGNDNLMELTHLFFLHTSTIGGYKPDAGPVEGEEYVVRQVGTQVHSHTGTPRVPNKAPIDMGVDPVAHPLIDRWNDIVWDMPSAMKFAMCATPAGGPRDVAPYMYQSHLITPETKCTSHYFWNVARTFELTPEGDAKYLHFFGNIFRTEDAPMIEDIQHNMGEADLWDLKPVVLPRDRGAVLVRRLVARALAAQAGAEAIAAE